MAKDVNASRFIFSACAIAVADNLEPPPDPSTGPPRAWAAVALPMVGGKASAEAGPVNNGVLSFNYAKAEVKGWCENSGAPAEAYITESSVLVDQLDIEDWLHADKIAINLRFRYQKNPRTLTADVSLAPYSGLRIATQGFSNVTLNQVIPGVAAADDDDFRLQLQGPTDPLRRKDKHHKHKSKSPLKKELKVHTSLAEDPGGRLQWPGPTNRYDYGYYEVVANGLDRRVYFGEWAEEDDWQGVVGLRIVFRDQNGNVERQIVIADWLGNNGQFYP